MANNNEFNSKKELDNLIELFASKTPVLPSEVLKMYNEIKEYIIRIHQLGYTKGYEKGVEFKKNIDRQF